MLVDTVTECFLVEFEGSLTPQGRLFGSNAELLTTADTQVFYYNTMEQFLTDHDMIPEAQWEGSDVFELCGGSAKATQVLITRRSISTGPNFDVIVGIDLLQDEHVADLWRYLERCKPICGILAPPPPQKIAIALL